MSSATTEASGNDRTDATVITWDRIATLVARVLIALGAMVLVFFVFQLWGTGWLEGQAQQDLSDELDQAIAEHRQRRGAAGVEPPLGPDPIVAGPLDEVASRPRPEPGAAVARIEAPSIGLDKTVVEGVGRPQLRDGPGLYPISPLPGHEGNVAIAGHRTTYGSPFADLDQLKPGDPILLETVDGIFTYRVEAQQGSDGDLVGHRIVDPDAIEVVADRGDNRLTLTSCHPRYSNRERLIVTALLDGPPVAFEAISLMAPFDQATSTLIHDLPLQHVAVGSRPGQSEPGAVAGLDEPLGWHFDRAAEALGWAGLLLLSFGLVAVLFTREHRVVAIAIAPLVSIYPLISLLLIIESMAPAW